MAEIEYVHKESIGQFSGGRGSAPSGLRSQAPREWPALGTQVIHAARPAPLPCPRGLPGISLGADTQVRLDVTLGRDGSKRDRAVHGSQWTVRRTPTSRSHPPAVHLAITIGLIDGARLEHFVVHSGFVGNLEGVVTKPEPDQREDGTCSQS